MPARRLDDPILDPVPHEVTGSASGARALRPPQPRAELSDARPGPRRVLVLPVPDGRPAPTVRRSRADAAVLADQWRRDGCEVVLVDPGGPPDGGSSVDPGAPLDAAALAVAVAAAGPAASVHAVGRAAAVAALTARERTGVPVVLELDEVPPAAGSRAWAPVAACDAVVVDSAATRDAACAAGVTRARLHVSGPAVVAPPVADAWSDPVGRGPRLLSVGPPQDAAALRALAPVLEAVPDAHLVVARAAGLDPGAADALREHLARDPVLGPHLPRVRVVTDPAADHCAAADLVVDASARLRRPLGVLTAMAAARAVVATAVGAVAEVVVDRTTGLLVPPADTRALRRAITGLLADPFRLEAYGLAGHDRVSAAYSPQRHAASLDALHSRLARTTGPSTEPVTTTDPVTA